MVISISDPFFVKSDRLLVPPLWGIQNASFISAPVLIH
jgi:hypothetical protein